MTKLKMSQEIYCPMMNLMQYYFKIKPMLRQIMMKRSAKSGLLVDGISKYSCKNNKI